MSEIEIDTIDRQILRLLQEDASLSAAAIGERIGLSQSPCWRRIHRMREVGLIQGEIIKFDRKKLGFKVPEFAQTIREFPEVLECHLVLGNVDFLLRIVTRDIEEYEHFFFEKLSHLPEVQEVTSNIVLSEIKFTTKLPI